MYGYCYLQKLKLNLTKNLYNQGFIHLCRLVRSKCPNNSFSLFIHLVYRNDDPSHSCLFKVIVGHMTTLIDICYICFYLIIEKYRFFRVAITKLMNICMFVQLKLNLNTYFSMNLYAHDSCH